MNWVKDVSKDEIDSYKYSDEYFLGLPKDQNTNNLGLYKKMRMLPIDDKLDPNNCEAKAYTFEGDTYYSPDAPDEAMDKDLFTKLDLGYKYGQPTSVNTMENGFIGIYRPIKK